MCDHADMWSRRVLVVVVCAVGAVGLVGCSSDESAEAPEVELTGEAARGEQVAADQGCTSCHRVSGEGGVGPSWAGLAGSEVELDDGSVVIADDEYLRRSIVEPNAQIVAGYNGIMPERALDDADVDALVAYLNALGQVGN